MSTFGIYLRPHDGMAMEVDTIDTESLREAVEFAVLHAAEHAERLDVLVTETTLGAALVTNNGTTVRYFAHYIRPTVEAEFDIEQGKTAVCACGRGMKSTATACSLACYQTQTIRPAGAR